MTLVGWTPCSSTVWSGSLSGRMINMQYLLPMGRPCALITQTQLAKYMRASLLMSQTSRDVKAFSFDKMKSTNIY